MTNKLCLLHYIASVLSSFSGKKGDGATHVAGDNSNSVINCGRGSVSLVKVLQSTASSIFMSLLPVCQNHKLG